jgi:DNA-binding response OmpR family regulator
MASVLDDDQRLNGPELAGPGSARPKTVLCVEDDRETAGLLSEELSERGYRVRVAHCGRDGFAAILADPPDLVLCDVSMPVMSGMDLLDRIKQRAPQFAEMPFVFLTAIRDRDTELKGRQLGADDYVAKPIDFDVLDAILKARLSRVARIAVWRREVELSDRELEALAWSARGKTSDEIAQIVGLTRRTINFHLDNARTKLRAANRTEAVATAVAARLIEI